MVLQTVSGVNIDMHGFECDADTASRLGKFMEQIAGYPDERSAQHGLLSAFGDTYMYYYSFQPLPVGPSHADAHYYVGNTLCSQDKVDLAVAQYRHALRLQPGFTQAHIKFGDALISQGKYDEAAGHYRAALRLKPDSAQARESLDRIKRLQADQGG